MKTKAGDHRVEIREKARGGKGSVELHHLLEMEQLAPNSRLLCKTIIEPGNSMGFHIHEGESEFFYVFSGVAKFYDGNEEALLYPGDTYFTPSGSGHSIEVIGEKPLEYLALVMKSA